MGSRFPPLREMQLVLATSEVAMRSGNVFARAI